MIKEDIKDNLAQENLNLKKIGPILEMSFVTFVPFNNKDKTIEMIVLEGTTTNLQTAFTIYSCL
jgi:hypothetical protein